MSNLSREEFHDEMLDIKDPVRYDESISEINYFEYTPQTQANNNSPSHQIKIEINAQDTYTLPSRSYISITGQIRRADNNNPYTADREITLINNAMMYLFSSVKYELGSTMIESINFPGQITSMLGYLTYPDDFSTSAGLKCCWSKDTTNNADSKKFINSPRVANVAAGIAVPEIAEDFSTPTENPNYNQGFAVRKAQLFSSDPLGCFTFHIPLTHIFGFAKYKKVIYGLKHTLTLTRSSDTEALFRSDTPTNGKVHITDIVWNMPHVQPSPEYLSSMRSIIERKEPIPLYFRARTSEQTTLTQTLKQTWRLSVMGGVEKPRWIIISLQTDRNSSQQQNPAAFDHLDLTNAYVTLNSVRFPIGDLNNDFARNDYMKLYDGLDAFKLDYYGIDSLVGGTQVNVSAFKSLYPIIVFDVRKQNERIKSGVMDIQVRLEFGTVVPAATIAYAVIISDRVYKLSSDGKTMIVVSICLAGGIFYYTTVINLLH